MISKEKYAQVKKLFQELVDLSDEERSININTIEDPEIKEEVCELLKNHNPDFTIIIPSTTQPKQITPTSYTSFISKWLKNKYRITIILFLLLITFISLGLYAHHSIKKSILNQTKQELTNISTSNNIALTDWVTSHEEIINTVLKTPTTKHHINKLLANNISKEHLTAENDSLLGSLAHLITNEKIASFQVSNKVGKVLATTEKALLGTTVKAGQLSKILDIYDNSSPKLITVPFDNSAESIITIAVPIKINKKVKAIVTFSYRVEESLLKIIETQKVGKTGKSIGFNKEGHIITHNSSYSKHKIAPHKLITKIIEGKNEKIGVTTTPYIGVNNEHVIGSYLWLPQYNLGVISEVSVEEAFLVLSQVHTIFYLLIGAIILLLIINTSLLIYNYRQQLKYLAFKTLGPYQILEKIGEGGMGTVYLTKHNLMKRLTAVKTLKKDVSNPSFLQKFEQEVLLTSKLTHPNTIQIYDYGKTENNEFYFAMEYLKGITLDRLIDATGKLPVERAIHILKQICSSLKEAHNNNLIHRDIKPQNIMVCYIGGLYDFVKVLDFGLVKDLNNNSDDLEIGGTPMYMSPERLTDPDNINQESDIYAIGVLAYYLLSGTKPYLNGITELDLINHIINTPPTALQTTLPTDLHDIIFQCLEKKPEKRPKNIDTILSVLNNSHIKQWGQKEAKKWWLKNLNNLLEIDDE